MIVFADFKKAFDGGHRGKMLHIMKAYDFPENLVKSIGLIHKGSQATVITPDGETEFFNILAAVLLGDTLVPYLFAIILNYAVRMAIGRGKEEELGFKLDRRRSRKYEKIC